MISNPSNSEQVTVSCPICKIDETKFLFRKDDLNVVSCCRCQLIYVNPRLSDKILAGGYSLDYYPAEKQAKLTTDPMEWAQMRERLAEVTTKVEGRKLLDLGCGMGTFLHLAQSEKWQSIGVDLSKEGCQFAREQYGLDVLCSDLFEANFPSNYFDVVTLFHVLEHVPDPNSLLIEINRVLKPSVGRLVIEVPNGGSIHMRFQKEKWPYVHPKDHLYYFTNHTLRLLLQNNGFNRIETGRPRRVSASRDANQTIKFSIQKPVSDLLVRLNLSTVIRLYASYY